MAVVDQRGKIIDVVSATKTDTFSTSSTIWIDIPGLSVTITPTSIKSRIKLSASVLGDADPDGFNGFFRFVRNSTPIGIGDVAGVRQRISFGFDSYAGGSLALRPASGKFIDSPALTTAITYKLQVIAQPTVTVYINRNLDDSDLANLWRGQSTLIAEEILL